MFPRTLRLTPHLTTIRTIMTSSPTTRVPIPPNGVDYRGKVVLAPMVRSGELPCRLLALHYGADLVWGPETVDHAMLGTTRRTNPRTGIIEFIKPIRANLKSAKQNPETKVTEQLIYRLDPVREAGRHIFQIGTSDPDRAAAVARLVARDVVGIDVNAGCPKPFSTSGGMGAALLRTPDKLCAILRSLVGTVVEEFAIGVSVKIRLLETPEQTETLVRQLCQTGITGLTIHCRTTDMRKTAPAIRDQLLMIGDICHEYGVACLMNGDVSDRDSALELAGDFGVDGAMIATAAETNSSCFRPVDKGGMAPWQEAVETYLGFALDTENFFGNTKYTLNIMIPGKESVHKKMHMSHSYVEVCEILGLEGLVDKAREVDRLQGIDPETKKRAEEEKERERREKAAAAKEKQRLEQMGKKRKHSPSPGVGDKLPRARSRSPTGRVERKVGVSDAVASF
jgi:tRNA-dihydrouridine synthase 2